MMRSVSSKWLTAGAVIVCLALIPTVGTAESMKEIAAFRAAGTSAMWIAEPGAAASILSVKGTNIQLRQIVRAGGSPVVSLARPDGTTLPDGVYVWELSESFAGVNDAVWDAANGRTTEAHSKDRQKAEVNGRVQRGAFAVRNGLVVDSSLNEADAK